MKCDLAAGELGSAHDMCAEDAAPHLDLNLNLNLNRIADAVRTSVGHGVEMAVCLRYFSSIPVYFRSEHETMPLRLSSQTAMLILVVVDEKDQDETK